MKRFVLLGAAGYIAPRHMQAIKDTGNDLVAIYDPFDSVGVIDRYFPDCYYFQVFERLDRFCHKMQRTGQKIDYVVIASPNHLHDSHCRWALRIGADVICEKPLVLTEKNLDALLEMEKETGNRIYGLYQLRHHPNFKAMKNTVKDKGNEVYINYATPRGNWYHFSWKGDVRKSGGVETNIGCHLFDVCSALFGSPKGYEIAYSGNDGGEGFLFFDNANVMYQLSVSASEPKRVFNINGLPFSFDSGFADLHTEVYKTILEGKADGIEEHRYAVRICEQIRKVNNGEKGCFE
jgi:UDP-N-acetyl-2-amino-2-deoxyglucuronate dehydrogenase